MLKLNEVLKASKLGGGAPDYWTELFARRMASGWKVTELTGTLPMTFRSNGTALIDYHIYGTADGAGVQTENEFDFTTVQMLSCYVSVDGIITYSANDRGVIVPVQPSTTYTLIMTRYAKEGAAVDDAAAIATTTFPERGTQGRKLFYAVHGDALQTFTTNADEYFVYFKFCNITRSYLDEQLQSIMLVKGSTPSESYIPYGYKLPLTVTSGAESKDTDIFIGDSKLLSTDYIDYESGKIVRNGTPQDPPLPFPELETFNGINTLDSTETLGEVTITGMIKEAE